MANTIDPKSKPASGRAQAPKPPAAPAVEPDPQDAGANESADWRARTSNRSAGTASTQDVFQGGAVPTASLKDILAVAALPSSQRIAGWRTAHFDQVKAAATKAMESNPATTLKSLLDVKADIGPMPDEIPPLVPALERVGARYAAGGYKSDIKRIDTLPSDVQDYVIIGAGMAGVSAGAVFADANNAGANLKGLVLEGGTVVGGRARDVDVNGKKAGLGPSWLHGKYNMLRRMADLLGLHRERTYLDREVYIDGKKASQKDTDALFKEESDAEDAMLKGAAEGNESKVDPASKFFPPGRWKNVAEAEMGRGDQGMNIGKVDKIDGADFQSNQDDFIKEGMQEFVTRIAKAAELPVSFNSQVKSAKRGADGIWTLTLTDGRSVRTKQVVFTGATASLANIDFDPPLPRAKAEVVKDALPMGNFTKFLFTTEEPLQRPGTFRNSWVVDAVTDPKTGKLHEEVQFVVKYGDDPRANIMFAAADVAKKILALPPDQQRAYIEKEFSQVAGSPMHLKDLAITPFAAEKNFRGCYSNLLPGMEGAHTAWAAPVHGMNFAGEASGTAQNNASLLAAFTSGVDSAYDVIRAVRVPGSKP